MVNSHPSAINQNPVIRIVARREATGAKITLIQLADSMMTYD